MKAFIRESGCMIPLYRSHIDTDALLPKAYLKRINKTGFGEFLFDDWRYLPDRRPNPDFILNEKRFAGAPFLLAGANFGCGSSREHAVWALDDYGIRAVIAPSFGDIFYNNCFKNGLLPALVSEATAEALFALSQEEEALQLDIDLAAQCIEAGGKRFPFEIDAFRKEHLLQGLDEIAQSLQHAPAIRDFEALYYEKFPWLR